MSAVLTVHQGRMARLVRLCLSGLAAIILLGCADRGTVQSPQSYTAILARGAEGPFQQVTGPAELRFPRDHGMHPDYQVEWWYLTGYLVDELGQEYGYQFTLFRYGLQRNDHTADSLFDRSTLYMGHFAITDVSRQRYLSAEHFARAPAGAGVADTEQDISLHLDDWQLTIGESNAMTLRAHARSDQTDFNVDLRLTAEGPLLLHGEDGFSRKGPAQGQASMYYSVIGLDTTGHMQIGDQTLAVHGTSWFDHEWSTNSLAADAVGWDWFSLQLDNGAALMLGFIRDRDPDATVPASRFRDLFPVSPVYVEPGGHMRQLDGGDFTLAVTDYWTSDVTGVQYPSGWQLDIPAVNLQCHLEPLLKNQEFIGVGTYWEGLVGAVCEHDGDGAQGRGYVELTGYR